MSFLGPPQGGGKAIWKKTEERERSVLTMASYTYNRYNPAHYSHFSEACLLTSSFTVSAMFISIMYVIK